MWSKPAFVRLPSEFPDHRGSRNRHNLHNVEAGAEAEASERGLHPQELISFQSLVDQVRRNPASILTPAAHLSSQESAAQA